jgi:hypothetical protein
MFDHKHVQQATAAAAHGAHNCRSRCLLCQLGCFCAAHAAMLGPVLIMQCSESVCRLAPTIVRVGVACGAVLQACRCAVHAFCCEVHPPSAAPLLPALGQCSLYTRCHGICVLGAVVGQVGFLVAVGNSKHACSMMCVPLAGPGTQLGGVCILGGVVSTVPGSTSVIQPVWCKLPAGFASPLWVGECVWCGTHLAHVYWGCSLTAQVQRGSALVASQGEIGLAWAQSWMCWLQALGIGDNTAGLWPCQTGDGLCPNKRYGSNKSPGSICPPFTTNACLAVNSQYCEWSIVSGGCCFTLCLPWLAEACW